MKGFMTFVHASQFVKSSRDSVLTIGSCLRPNLKWDHSRRIKKRYTLV